MSARGISIRPARADDLDVIHAIEVASFSDPWKRTGFRDLMLGGRAHVAVAVDEVGSVVGFGVLLAAADEAEIANVAVAVEGRRRGTGAALVDHLLGTAMASGAASVYLEVRESNAPARALYAAKGFTEVARRRRYYRNPEEDAVVMRHAAPAIR